VGLGIMPIGKKHTFLKSASSLSAISIIKHLQNYESCALDDKDKEIARQLYEEIKAKGELPGWWSPQETTYLGKVGDHKTAVRYIVFRYKFRVFPRNKITPEFPIYVLIEPVSACNLECPFCFQVDKSFTRKPYMGFMDMDLFVRIVDECEANGTGAITIASRGEPTLHPRLPEMLDYLKGKFFEIKLNTNGTRLTEELCHAILRNEVNDFVLSIDTEQKELFEVMRKNAKFDEVFENVKLLNRIRNEHYSNSNTVVRVSGVHFFPEQDHKRFAEFWGKMVDEVTINPAEERWDTYNNPRHPDISTPCTNIWERFYVWFDGTCNPCDVDYKSELSPGVVSADVSIKSIWHSANLQKLKRIHLSGERSSVLPCDRCGVS
jgi:sulfatase maturation enzyme AslB (radical SAM superfamily)